MPEVPRLDHDEPGFRLATWRNVVASIWSGSITLPRLDLLLQRERQIRRLYPAGLVPFTVVASMPTEALKVGEPVRERAAAMAREMGPVTIAHPNVVLGGGFWAATVRGVMSAAYLFSRATYPTRAFDSVGDACAWLAPVMARTDAKAPSAIELRSAVDEMLRDLKPSPPLRTST